MTYLTTALVGTLPILDLFPSTESRWRKPVRRSDRDRSGGGGGAVLCSSERDKERWTPDLRSAAGERRGLVGRTAKEE